MASALPANMTEAERKAMGLRLQALAYSEPKISPEGLAMIFIVVTSTTMALATVVVALRIYARLPMTRFSKGWGWRWDDSFIVLSYGAFLSSAIFSVKAACYGLGTRDSKLNQLLMIRCAEYMLYAQVLYGLSMPLIKASVVLMLLHFTTEKKYRWTLYTMQFIATVMAIIGILASLLYCHPIEAYWNPLLGKCGDYMIVVRIGYAWTAVGIVTDWCTAILPWFIVRKLQMSRKSKASIIVILGLGAIASTATIVRAPYLKYYLVEEDRLYWNGYIILWCLLESGIGIVASSLPALRSLFIGFLETTRYGSGNRSTGRSGSGSKPLNPVRGSKHGKIPLDTLSTNDAGRQWKRLDDDSSSKVISVDHAITVEYESSSDGGHKARGDSFMGA